MTLIQLKYISGRNFIYTSWLCFEGYVIFMIMCSLRFESKLLETENFKLFKLIVKLPFAKFYFVNK